MSFLSYGEYVSIFYILCFPNILTDISDKVRYKKEIFNRFER